MAGPNRSVLKVLSRQPSENFDRLSPLAVVAFFSDRLPVDILVLVIIVGFAFLAGGIYFPLAIAAAVLILAVDITYSWLYISRLVFTLENECIHVRKGVITPGHTMIPYENIQDVHVVQSLTGRIFGVWSVIIFTATATAAGSEQVIGLENGTAERFKESIFQKMKEARHVTD